LKRKRKPVQERKLVNLFNSQKKKKRGESAGGSRGRLRKRKKAVACLQEKKAQRREGDALVLPEKERGQSVKKILSGGGVEKQKPSLLFSLERNCKRGVILLSQKRGAQWN